ncbi:glycine-tRNA ligase (GARS1) [Vairimorpha necatrix]|uniref:glycine--tRNA ligase n=1 Tax=Vairimorpha necatrix TaxID=6039 RepID=A0AAX4JEA9_9MICR
MRKFDTQKLEQILKSRFFINQTAQIYGGMAGLFDMGPILFGIKQNFFSLFRKHFIQYDKLFEIDTSILLPYSVLKSSGHVDKFCDILIIDKKNKNSYRADHLIIDYLSKLNLNDTIKNDIKRVDVANCLEIDELIKKYKILSPDNNELSSAMKFNLMFETNLGYKENQSVFLRPETAQGQFLNFKKLYEFNNKKMPFGSASIGKAFRNEISPRSGLIRTREFEQAEIEFFVSPTKKNFEKFLKVKNLKLKLCFDDKEKLMSLEDAVKSNIIDNEILGYFIGRTYLFLEKIGIDTKLIRFRQHKKDEMAHYAKDCWDCEIFSSYGWIECVGIADRSAYDLTCHSKATGIDLSFSEKIVPPINKKEWKVNLVKKDWIKIFKKDYEVFNNEISSLDEEFIKNNMFKENDKNFLNYKFQDKDYKLECSLVDITIHEIKTIPDVIEPSFGVGRILYILLEHAFYMRENRPVLRLKPIMSHTKVVISYVVFNTEFTKYIEEINDKLYNKNIVVEINDRSCSIGKKYSSCDEIGVPFFITFDPESLIDNKVTIRERDSMEQIRVKISEVVELITELVNENISWEEIKLKN